MKKVMFLALVLSVVSLGSAMANDAYAPLDGKPKNVVINVNMPPAGGPVGNFNPGCPPPPPPVGVCNCHKNYKVDKCHHNAPKPRPGKKPNKGHNPHFAGKPGGAPVGVPYGGPGGPGGAPNGGPGGAPAGRPGGR